MCKLGSNQQTKTSLLKHMAMRPESVKDSESVREEIEKERERVCESRRQSAKHERTDRCPTNKHTAQSESPTVIQYTPYKEMPMIYNK